jgi:probable O-glycosylation ligase (exosortase A-associated)
MYFPVLETLRINTVVPLVAFALALLAPAGRPNGVIFRHPVTRWMLFFVALFCVQFLTADVKLYVFEKLTAIIGYLLIYYVILRNVTTAKRCKAVFTAIVGVHVLMLVLHPAVILEPERRHFIGGTFLGDGNDFAWSACIAIPMAFLLAHRARTAPVRLAWLAVVGLLVIAIVGTQSRGGSLGLVGVAAWAVINSRRRLVGMLALAALIGAVLVFAPQAYFKRMETLSAFQTEGSAQARLMTWGSAVRMAMDHPLVGVGAGHFSVKYGVEYRPPGVGRRDIPWQNAHSIYFVTLGEFGFSGIIFLVSVIALGFQRMSRAIKVLGGRGMTSASELRDIALAAQCSLIGFAVAGAFLSGIYYPHLFVVSALCVAVSFLAGEARGAAIAMPVERGRARDERAPRGAEVAGLGHQRQTRVGQTPSRRN